MAGEEGVSPSADGREGYVPLKITFRISTPICLTYPWIHFDALLAHLALRKKDPEGYRSLPSKKVIKNAAEVEIPLKKTAGVYHGSVSIFDIPSSERYASTVTIYKRFCEKYLDIKRIRKKRIDKGRGYFKSFMIRLVYLPVRSAVFYACGKPSEIGELLEGLPGLGKKTAIGFGSIRSFSVERIDRDLSIFDGRRLNRQVPVRLLGGPACADDIVAMAWKPPYWAKENVELCVPPFTEVRRIPGHGSDSELIPIPDPGG